jgi:magnesium-transporting ATPase (P-type)
MSKHILGQAIYQISVILVMLFAGHLYLTNNADYSEMVSKGWEVDEESDEYPSMHFTYLFNTFVWLQIFNFVCARKIKDEFNIFKGISKSIIFFVIVLIIILFQVSQI